MNRLLRRLFYLVFVRGIVLLVLGLNVRDRHKLPQQGPAVIIANHNSHLDTLVLMTLLPLHLLDIVHPVAAGDYFLKNRVLAWFALKIIGILPIRRHRQSDDDDPLATVSAALGAGKIVLFFPEGTRGEPEKLTGFKKGIAHLMRSHPQVPVIPVFMHGLGKALPKGESLLVPFFCDVFVGDPLPRCEDVDSCMRNLDATMQALAEQGELRPWD